jgi:hypothetical protein
MPLAFHHFVPSCLDAFVPVAHFLPRRKTGAVLRFCDHGGAARFYKSGKCRGNWVKIVLDFSLGTVGFLINGAQRAPVASRGFPVWIGASIGSFCLTFVPEAKVG